MKNVAYTSEYQDYRKEFDYVFNDMYLSDTKIKELSQDFSLKIYHYKDYSHKIYPYNIDCNSAELINKQGEIVYSTQSVYYSTFYDLIEHKNGKRYLVFRIGLYGYSILDLSTMKDYHYIPEESFKGGETFIWTRTHYNKNTNLLIAKGCFWACPNDIFVVDFSEPTNLPYTEFDLNIYLDYDNYEDIDFVNWDDKDNLIIKCYDIKAENYITKVIEKETCINKLKL